MGKCALYKIMQEIENRPDVLEKIEAADTPDEILTILVELGYNVNLEQIEDFDFAPAGSFELDDLDFKGVADGWWHYWTGSYLENRNYESRIRHTGT
jgi:hypothetical protein